MSRCGFGAVSQVGDAAVMRVTTLKASGDKLPQLLAYYAGLAEDHDRSSGAGRGPVDYYLDPGEPPGRWWGRDALGLDGTVDAADLRELLEGRDPQSGDSLGRRFGDTSARGFDATFSAPKSVSVLWAVTPDPWVRAEALAAHDAAVDAALGWFEAHGAVTRRGTDGVFQVDALGVTAALFRQHTSRTVDPQLHTHALVSSKVQDATGHWFALDARFLKYQQRSIGAIYDAALRAELTARLGVGWVERDDGVFDLGCVPYEVRDVFSQRTVQVETKHTELIRRWSKENGGAEPDARTVAMLERRAVTSSRPGKSHGVDADSLHQQWTADARTAGLSPDRLDHRSLAEDLGTAPEVTDEAVIERALRTATQESATWLRADLARHIAQQLDHRVASSGVDLVAEIDRLAALAERHCVALAPERDGTSRHRADGRPITEHVTDRRLVTPQALKQEQVLQHWAHTATEPVRRTADPQAEATRAMAGNGRLVLVVGPAGTGKTHATAQAVSRLRREDRPVVGLAPSGKAADVLATEAGCRTDTLAGFLTRHRDRDRPSPWPAGTTVVLDEAGMAATNDLARLVLLAHRNGWRIAAVGDPEQLPAVGRGGVFAHWCETLPHHALDTPRRFAEQWEADASLGLRAGRPDAVADYERHGRLNTGHPSLVPHQVARWHQRHAERGLTVAITTNGAETARAINREIQWVTDPRRPRPVELRDGTHVGIGDRIATRRNRPDLTTDRGDRVRNRHTWTVTATHPDGGITVEHPDRGTAELPARYVAEHVELGWAVTGYGNQGDTVDVGIAILEPGTSRNHAYVAMTRGRHRNDAIVLDASGTADPADGLAEIITRPADAESALAVQARLHQAAGIDPPDATVARTGERDDSARPEPEKRPLTTAELHAKYKPVRPPQPDLPYRPPPGHDSPGIGLGR